MLILLLVISILLIIVGCLIFYKHNRDIGEVVSYFGLAGFIIMFILIAFVSVGVTNLKVIDQKIGMYQEENSNIETQIDTLVKQYMNYESGTFKELKGENIISLVSLYPELKSDVLVQNQMNVYLENNKKIKELKEKKINGIVKKWWLYFGK